MGSGRSVRRTLFFFIVTYLVNTDALLDTTTTSTSQNFDRKTSAPNSVLSDSCAELDDAQSALYTRQALHNVTDDLYQVLQANRQQFESTEF